MSGWLEHIVNNKLLYHTIVAVVIVVVFAFLSSLVKRTMGWFARKVFAKTETELDDLIVATLQRNVRSLMVIFGLHVGLREIRKAAELDDVTLLQILSYADTLVYLAGIFVLVRVILGVLRVFINWSLDRVSDDSSQLKRTLGPLASKIVGLIVGLVAAIIVLDHFDVNIGSLLVSLGVGSLAVALAAQDTLANMIAGFVILADRPFRVGDRIELPSGQIGDVQQIGLRSTLIMNFDSNVIVVPNAELVKGRIVNFAYPHNQMRAIVKVSVAYGTEASRVRSILLDIARSHPDILPDPPPDVFFTAMNDSALEFTLIARASDFTKRYKAECDLREQIYEALNKHNIEIPFPQRVVHMKNPS